MHTSADMLMPFVRMAEQHEQGLLVFSAGLDQKLLSYHNDVCNLLLSKLALMQSMLLFVHVAVADNPAQHSKCSIPEGSQSPESHQAAHR